MYKFRQCIGCRNILTTTAELANSRFIYNFLIKTRHIYQLKTQLKTQREWQLATLLGSLGKWVLLFFEKEIRCCFPFKGNFRELLDIFYS